MKDARWQQLKEVFHSALEREPERRAAFLAEACAGQDSLRREVESLISSHEQSGHFIDTPAFEAAARMLEDSQEFKPGETIGHYEICSVLGEGGMGKVYLAEDTKLKRKVALKVLAVAGSSDEEARGRLLLEARAAAALDHPNICAIYEVDEKSDPSYIAMQFIEGETLEARLGRERLSLDDSLNVAARVADALGAAHAQGIIHRDIKPSNIMLANSGQVKVLDFGLAKTVRTASAGMDGAETSQTLTTPGMILGTVPYMSPEQLRGELVDVRSDVFSFGVVLYEMLSGQPAFKRSTDAETIGAILHEQPPELSSVDPNLPKALSNVISKCLAKDVTRRYPSVQQVARDLDAARSGELATMELPANRTAIDIPRFRKRTTLLVLGAVIIALVLFSYYAFFVGSGEAVDSIAVLPFENSSKDPDGEYLSYGLSDSIINSLSQLPTLKRVISLRSVSRYKGKQVDPQAVGRELNVRAVLTGKLVQRGDDLIISAELVDVQDNKRLWGGQYRRKLSDLLAFQGQISQEIAEGLRLSLTGEQRRQLTKPDTNNGEAYQLYLLGRFHRRDRTSYPKAIEYLEQAIVKDPNYAPAYAQLAYTYGVIGFLGGMPAKEAREKEAWAVRMALDLDDGLADAHAVLGLMRADVQDWPASIKEFQRALELDPNSADVHSFYAKIILGLGRFDEAMAHMRRAQELDPLSPAMYADAGRIFYCARQYDQASEQYQRALELSPDYALAHLYLANLYLTIGRYDEAIAESKRTRSSEDSAVSISQIGYAYAVSGKKAEAQKMLDELNRLSRQRYVNPHQFALIYSGLGDKDKAFAYLQKQYEDHPNTLNFIKVDPVWDNLRSDSRFTDFLRRMKLAT